MVQPQKNGDISFHMSPSHYRSIFLVHLILKKNIMQFRTGKHHQAICDSNVNQLPGNSVNGKNTASKFPVPSAHRGFRCHLPPGLLENPPCSDDFPTKKCVQFGDFPAAFDFKKTGKCPNKSPLFTVNHRYSPVLSMIYHYIFTIIDRY